MDDTTPRPSPLLAFLGPAMAAASASAWAAAWARHFSDLAIGTDTPRPEPAWTTPHRIALTLPAVTLRDFSTGEEGVPALLCAPYTLHGATVADLAPEHSLVAALQAAGLGRLFLTDWQSATAALRLRTIDDCLADLNVMVDDIGAPCDLVGLCQGGWLALVYAARFPGKVRRLVLAGAPVDLAAGAGMLTRVTRELPQEAFDALVRVGDGCVRGRSALRIWPEHQYDAAMVRAVLQTAAPLGSLDFALLETRFRTWYRWVFDLPGPYFLETVQRLYRDNELVSGRFVALGRRVDLGTVTTPLYLVAGRDDDLVPADQVLAAARLTGGPSRSVIAPGGHLSLFMGRQVLESIWPAIAGWLQAPDAAQAAAVSRAAAGGT